ncbi:ABC transporter substrate-binding protein [Bradyrhizobium brasilense]|uniref:ABC transporter substrate-binding protein n=1 Tax=Bradyrhizobium brasilense TaxID=1419277 RepID=A0ABY8JBU2_9BRAD|nr:ABC transporter substrate-binding protein [Bradyrhizobium brasilense]WFU62588.1 ABC transporter substrate-binding protein [Bradyrhizobium brasilense]
MVDKTTTAFARENLAGAGEVVVFSHGGSFTQNLRKHVFDPFTKATGIKVVDVIADLAEPQVNAMHQAGRVDWDVAIIYAQAYPELAQAGMFVPIDYSLWDDDALHGVPESARLKDAVVAFQSAILLVCDDRAFPKNGPKNWADFWNVKEFPGPRGLNGTGSPTPIISALMADGVAPKDLWPLSDEKIERALKKLDEIKPHITKWWTAGGEPIQLLINGEYALTSAPDGRALAAIKKGVPIRMVWDGAATVENYWTVLKGGPNSQNAQKFIAFVNQSEMAAAFTQGTGFPGPNKNQLKQLPADLLPLISIDPENAAMTIGYDATWLAAKRADGKTNGDYIAERFLAWRAR